MRKFLINMKAIPFTANKLILYLLYPPRCPACDGITGTARSELCISCKKLNIRIKEPFCKKCGMPLDNPEREFCYDCCRKKHQFDQGISCFPYTGYMKESVHRFKYSNKREYADFYGKEIMAASAEYIALWKPDIIIPVPLHKKRYRYRGFNQSEILARIVSEHYGIPMAKKLVKRIRNTRPLKEYSVRERHKSLKEAFSLDKKYLSKEKLCLSGKSILIIDDIYTTGSTINEISALLRQNGVIKVYFITLCNGNGY